MQTYILSDWTTVFWAFCLHPSAALVYFLVNSRGLRLCRASELHFVLLCVAERACLSSMPSHLGLKLCSLSNTVIVLLAVWCCWPKTLILFYHCTRSISEMPAMRKKSSNSFLPLWPLAFLAESFCLVCGVLCMRPCCRTWLVSARAGSINWQLWCCMKSRFNWWGLWPSASLAGGALQDRWLYGRSVLLKGARFESGTLLSGWQWPRNKCTGSSVCAASTARTDTPVS